MEVTIVGAGITGLFVAWHLAHAGVGAIRVIDRSGIGSGATAIQPGGVRQQWSTQTACRLAREAYRFYTELGERLELPLQASLERCGYLFVAEEASDLDQLRRNVSLQNALGIPSRIVTPPEAGALVPGLNSEAILGGAWCEQDGYFDRPQGVVWAVAQACRDLRVEFRQESVSRIAADGGGWRLELGADKAIHTAQVVVAAGCETAGLLQSLGVAVPIRGEKRHLFYSDPIRERLLEPLVVSPRRHFAAKQLADGSVLTSDLAADGDPAENKAAWHAHVRRSITALVPILEYVSFPVLVQGEYDTTADRQPILGPVADHPGIWLAAGMNGRGFMLAPAIGRIVSDAITGSPVSASLNSLTLDRFADGELVIEHQVV